MITFFPALMHETSHRLSTRSARNGKKHSVCNFREIFEIITLYILHIYSIQNLDEITIEIEVIYSLLQKINKNFIIKLNYIQNLLSEFSIFKLYFSFIKPNKKQEKMKKKNI